MCDTSVCEGKLQADPGKDRNCLKVEGELQRMFVQGSQEYCTMSPTPERNSWVICSFFSRSMLVDYSKLCNCCLFGCRRYQHRLHHNRPPGCGCYCCHLLHVVQEKDQSVVFITKIYGMQFHSCLLYNKDVQTILRGSVAAGFFSNQACMHSLTNQLSEHINWVKSGVLFRGWNKNLQRGLLTEVFIVSPGMFRLD